ncbi:aminotransferase class IV [Parapedobacter koreensis]|uniref:D-alanine transaminase n=1 Tax=Parapedobacter koreensis TaxID=332977 RepID=A0A1H7TRW3_9SPHI|nr:aminotransferase class IV [Parapedobacter koreensis]SEL87580.1 D-alanine transaminase [Parapedobacter koreensis]
MNYPNEVFLNGQWLPAAQATVSVFDRGFMLGDGIYEVIPFYRRKLFTLEKHVQRLQQGLTSVGIGYDVDVLRGRIVEAIMRSDFEDGAIYMQVTRGVAPRMHRFPADIELTALLYAYPFRFEGFEQKIVPVLLSEDLRWHRCNIKSISLMGNVLANQAAHQADMAENVFHRHGWITEGSHTSVLFVRDGTVYTHPNGPYILPGVTRDIVLSITDELGIIAKEEAVAVADLQRVEEAFLAGTTTQVTAIGSFFIDGERLDIGNGGVGPVTRLIQDAFIKRINTL